MKQLRFAAAIITSTFALAACQDDDPDAVPDALTRPLTLAWIGHLDGVPLALDSKTYPALTASEGFRPSRVSMFVSDLRLVAAEGDAANREALLSEVSYVELGTDGRAELTLDIPGGQYDELRFTLGLSEAQDATTPADYAPDEPLARASEYWVDWGSYIFLKLEGRSDTLADGVERFDAAYVYHVGRSSELARKVTVPIELVADGEGFAASIGVNLAALLSIGQPDELSVAGAADHRNVAAGQIMRDAGWAFGRPE